MEPYKYIYILVAARAKRQQMCRPRTRDSARGLGGKCTFLGGRYRTPSPPLPRVPPACVTQRRGRPPPPRPRSQELAEEATAAYRRLADRLGEPDPEGDGGDGGDGGEG